MNAIHRQTKRITEDTTPSPVASRWDYRLLWSVTVFIHQPNRIEPSAFQSINLSTHCKTAEALAPRSIGKLLAVAGAQADSPSTFSVLYGLHQNLDGVKLGHAFSGLMEPSNRDLGVVVDQLKLIGRGSVYWLTSFFKAYGGNFGALWLDELT
jgi:hypothetical protein